MSTPEFRNPADPLDVPAPVGASIRAFDGEVRRSPGPPQQAAEPARRGGRLLVPALLFLATCYTTARTDDGIPYAATVLLILGCHEFGHYLQARRYHVSASLPYFIPMPYGPLGTMGAVIGMRGNMGDRRSLFDIGITGPLAGLVPTIICCVVGLRLSTVVDVPRVITPETLGNVVTAPLLFQFLSDSILGPLSPGKMIDLHPVAFAGWVGIFITALNMIPIGQLDGGHVLYALFRRKAHVVATLLLAAAFVGVLLTGLYGWSLMLMLLWLVGPNHPPTANDEIQLGAGRTVLGWMMLLFPIVGFTPTPFLM